MKKNVIYEQLRAIVLDNDYTPAQVRGLTKKNMSEVLCLEAESIDDGFFVNMKNCLLRDIERDRDSRDFLELNQKETFRQVLEWLQLKWPEVEIENTARQIVIHKYGRPVVEESV